MLCEGRGGGESEECDDDDWPVCENVLRSLCEDVRPIQWKAAEVVQEQECVAAAVRSCLAERVEPSCWAHDATGPAVAANERPLRVRPRWWPPAHEDVAVVTAAGREQTRLMAARSAYADGNYYASAWPYASRTVEELSLWPCGGPQTTDMNRNTYTVGTVLYDDTGHGRSCHLHGLADPRRRVAVDFSLLPDRLPRHRSTVKMFSELRSQLPSPPVLVPHHFHVLARAAPFR